MSSPTGKNSPARPAAPSVEGAECPECRRPLPIRAKKAGERPAHWECTTCRSQLTGILVKELAAQGAASIRLSQVHFDTDRARPPSSYLRQLVTEFVACRLKNPDVDERRATQRVPMLLDLAVVPVDENWSPRAKPVLGIMIDVTANGLGLVTGTRVEAEHVALQIQHPAGLVQLLGKIAWNKDFGPGFHNAGVQFVLRFGRATIAGAPPPASAKGNA